MKMPIVVSICVSAFLITGALTVFGQSGSECEKGYDFCEIGGGRMGITCVPLGQCPPVWNARGGNNSGASNNTQGQLPCLTPATAKTASECKSADGMWHVECGKGTCKSKVSTSSGGAQSSKQCFLDFNCEDGFSLGGCVDRCSRNDDKCVAGCWAIYEKHSKANDCPMSEKTKACLDNPNT